jgi:hypothetical protein
MTVLTIRTHKRYATRQKVRLRTLDAACAEGLLIELSAEGCRISNLGSATSYSVGQEVCLDLGDDTYQGRIRWSRDGLAGVRLDTALHTHEVAALLAQAHAGQDTRRYGT